MPTEPVDLMPQGDPETVVLLPTGGSLVGLLIRGLDTHLLLGIREDECGRPVSCAVGIEMEIAPQSNPQRQKHGYSEDTGGD